MGRIAELDPYARGLARSEHDFLEVSRGVRWPFFFVERRAAPISRAHRRRPRRRHERLLLVACTWLEVGGQLERSPSARRGDGGGTRAGRRVYEDVGR